MKRVLAGLLLALCAAVLAGACGGGGGDGGGANAAGDRDGRLLVVTTVSPLTSMVANVAGTYADVMGLVPEGTNSHTFEPAPSVAETLAEADVIFVNGLQLEEPTVRLAERHKPAGTAIVRLGDAVLPEDEWIFDFSFPKEHGKPNPHVWTDPSYAVKYVEVIADALAAADPDDADAYRDNGARYGERILALDEAVREATATVPRERRRLLTYHDAYAYFARTYGWTVIGAVQVESFDEPSAKEVAELIEQVRREQVPAIFGSEVFPSPVLAQIGREAGVRYVDVLRDDDLPGKPGDPEHSYLGLMRFDFVTMVEALGGDATALEQLDVGDVVDDDARYPQ